ncbi:MAG: hypothetical protein JXA08_08840 [Methanomicrobiaceae archaeon]|nr:hypothetical protein [Methanomicrobiaceae archaeon]
MLSAHSLFFIVSFLFFLQGLSYAVIGLILYAALSYLPFSPAGRGALALLLAAACTAAFAAGSSGMGYAAGALVFTVITPLEITAPLLVLGKREKYLSCAGYPVIFTALFLAAGTGGILQTLNIYPLLSSVPYSTPEGMFLIRMVIYGILSVILSAGFFIALCEALRRRAHPGEDDGALPDR